MAGGSLVGCGCCSTGCLPAVLPFFLAAQLCTPLPHRCPPPPTANEHPHTPASPPPRQAHPLHFLTSPHPPPRTHPTPHPPNPPPQVCAIVFVPKLTALNGSDMFRSLVIIAFANYSLAVVATQVLLYLARGSLWARYLVSW